MKTLLTRKQSWRRQTKHEPDHLPPVDNAYTDLAQSSSIIGQLFWTMTRVSPPKEPKINKKSLRSVRFQTSVRVILIPSRPEYIAAGLLSVLWWEKSDFPLFKTSAVSEVITLMQLKNIKNCKDAMKILYQTESKVEKGSTADSDSADDSENMTLSDGSLSPRVPDVSKSCIKPINSVGKTSKRPILCVLKEDKLNHIQRHLHPLAYICD